MISPSAQRARPACSRASRTIAATPSLHHPASPVPGARYQRRGSPDGGRGQACVVYKPNERPSQAGSGIVEGDGSIAESLVPFANTRLLECFVISLAANRKMCGPFEHAGEEVGYVLERRAQS